MKRFVTLIAAILLIGVSLRAQTLSDRDRKAIESQSTFLVQAYEAILNLLADSQLENFEKKNASRDSYYTGYERRLFYSRESRVELDLTPTHFKNGSEDFKTVDDYLDIFMVLFKPDNTAGVKPVEIKILEVKDVFERNYVGNQVIVEISLNGTDKQGIPFGKSNRLIETRAEKGKDGKWNVYIASVLFYNGQVTPVPNTSTPSPKTTTPTPVETKTSDRQSDADGDGVPDSGDNCPNEYGLGPQGCPDIDGDGVPDKYDKCKEMSGSKKTEGCPDSDDDGVPDHLDECPYTVGLKSVNGCPDSDGDGVIDSKDRCKFTAGLSEHAGCPDRDRDGIPDIDDECDLQPGPKQNNGCPQTKANKYVKVGSGRDSDGDGIPDEIDQCKDVKGPAKFTGCPDTDGDGTPDNQDICKTVKGPKKTFGCPDRDGDGVPDYQDKCVDKRGPKSNNGCPVVNSGLFWANSYFAFNYRLLHKAPHSTYDLEGAWNEVKDKARSDFSSFDIGEFGVSFYAPVGLYFFGYQDTRSSQAPRIFYRKADVESYYPQLESMGISYEPLQFQGLQSSALSYRFGINFTPFYKMKVLRHLFFKIGYVKYEGQFWEEYSGSFPNNVLRPSLNNGNYAMRINGLQQGTDYELGAALVFPFLNLEFTYFNLDKSVSVLGGVNLPIRMLLSRKKRIALRLRYK